MVASEKGEAAVETAVSKMHNVPQQKENKKGARTPCRSASPTSRVARSGWQVVRRCWWRRPVSTRVAATPGPSQVVGTLNWKIENGVTGCRMVIVADAVRVPGVAHYGKQFVS